MADVSNVLGQTVTVLSQWDQKHLVEVISEAFNLSKGKAKQLLDARNVFVNNKRIWIAKHRVRTGDKIQVAGLNHKADSKIEIVFEDQWFLIVNKPPGILSNGSGSVEEKLQKIKKSSSIKVVHRLDRDTSGVIIAAKNDDVFEKFKQIFSEHRISKIYSALVVGYGARPKNFSINTPLDGKSALSEITCKQSNGKVSLIEVKIITGRTHQIRRHLQTVSMAILGDKEYFNKLSNSSEFRGISRQMLHATALEFEHPLTQQKIRIKAKYPEDFETLLKKITTQKGK